MPKLYIFCGIPFSGKSFLAKEVAKRFGFVRIDLDEVKFKLFGKDIEDENIDQRGWDKIYAKTYEKIRDSLKMGKTVVYDTGNFTKHERSLVRDIANKLDIESTTVHVDTPASVARERLANNRKMGQRFDVTDEDFESTVREMEPPDESENHITYTPDLDFESWIDKNFTKE